MFSKYYFIGNTAIFGVCLVWYNFKEKAFAKAHYLAAAPFTPSANSWVLLPTMENH